MHVVATAGHVDHGKSTLVRALTGMEPDRWAEERRRGMTIDLGYAWTALDNGETLAFVDVPGHQRFIGNMLAGLGPAPAVLFVVAADEGWRRQSAEHLAAVAALGLAHGLLTVTRSDLADPEPAVRQALSEISRTSLGAVPHVTVSGRTGQGLPALRAALTELTTRLPTPDPGAPVRLWVDRAFSVRGSGTVVTGTLAAGTLTVGDPLQVGDRMVRVRGLHSVGRAEQEVSAVARVAVNLRGVELADVGRGDALLTPEAFREVAELDVRLSGDPRELTTDLVLHVGSTAVACRVRPLGPDTARLRLHRPLPLRIGDRALLRDPGRQQVVAGVLVLDADPPVLARRGAAVRRGDALVGAVGAPDATAEVARRGATTVDALLTLGADPETFTGRAVGPWRISDARWEHWCSGLRRLVEAHHADRPLDAGPTGGAAVQALALPDPRLLGAVAQAAGLELAAGRLRAPGPARSLGPAEPGVQVLEKTLSADPFGAPEADALTTLGLGKQELAAAERAGRLLRLGGGVVLLPDGPARALRVLAGLGQPFTVSAARQALGTTRRVAVPLLEHTDARGWTRRLDGALRTVVRPAG